MLVKKKKKETFRKNRIISRTHVRRLRRVISELRALGTSRVPEAPRKLTTLQAASLSVYRGRDMIYAAMKNENKNGAEFV